MKLINIGIKELVNSKKFLLFFLINLSIGLSGLNIIESFKDLFNTELLNRSKVLLGANLSIEGRLQLSTEKKKKVAKMINATRYTESINLFSMIRVNKKSRLVYLSTLDNQLPYYGEKLLESGSKIPGITLKNNEIIVYQDLLIQLKLKLGDLIKIGASEFIIKDIIIEDQGQVFDMGSVAPKIIISKDGISNAQLLKKGSTRYYKTFFKTKIKIDQDLKNKLVTYIGDNAFKVIRPLESSNQMGRMINYLTDFLGLVSIVALYLSLIGVFYLYRSYLSEKRGTFAIYKTLGLSSGEILITQSILLISLGIMGSIGAIFLGIIVSPIISKIIESAILIVPGYSFNITGVLITILVGIGGVLLIGIPLIFSALKECPSNLFEEEIDSLSNHRMVKTMHFIPLIIFFILLSIFVSNSIKVGILFSGIIIGIAALIYPTLIFSLRLIEKLNKVNIPEFKLSLRYLTSYRLSTISIFLSLFFGSMLINFIPTLQKSIQMDLDGAINSPTPSLFLFDIQSEQKKKIEKYISNKGAKIMSLSPLIRARLKKINGNNLNVDLSNAVTREDERAQRFKNRGVNLTYRNKLNNTEKIVEGSNLKPFDGIGIPEVGLEIRYAKRLGIKIGDILTFDISGIEQEGIVRNIRKVRWTSFRPNFFISFSHGVLEDAPQTFLGTIEKVDSIIKTDLQTSIVEVFPN
ncbi:MAG: hypothetical protein HOJ35_03700, partial [Bdellovibrionales bacterium]|nr:hypothetical protein [Bdellovibrionales bacterium]